jgi:hypothetical protein
VGRRQKNTSGHRTEEKQITSVQSDTLYFFRLPMQFIGAAPCVDNACSKEGAIKTAHYPEEHRQSPEMKPSPPKMVLRRM